MDDQLQLPFNPNTEPKLVDIGERMRVLINKKIELEKELIDTNARLNELQSLLNQQASESGVIQ